MKSELHRSICEEIRDMGGRALLVGGCVRDRLLGIEAQDIDCEVHDLPGEALYALLSRYGEVDRSGEPFGVFTLKQEDFDFALPRRERRTGRLHTDFEVTPIPSLSPEQAAARRDFTINAVMQDALTGELIDPYGGESDLRRGVLRAVPGGQFEEDPLRVLRGAQFCARFHLYPDEDTLSSMRRMPLDELSGQRVFSEMKKALLHADRPSVFFRVLRDAGALMPWLRELDALVGLPQSSHHPEGDAFEHTMLVIDEAAAVRRQMEDPLSFMLAALTHDLGKPAVTVKNEQGEWSARGHGEAGVPLIEAMLTRLGAGRGVIEYCSRMCRWHMPLHTCYYLGKDLIELYRVFDACGGPYALAMLCICDARGTGKPRSLADREEAFLMERLRLYEQAAIRPMPTGEMFIRAGAKPGRQMRQRIACARELTLMGMDAAEAVQAVLREEEQKENQ